MNSNIETSNHHKKQRSLCIQVADVHRLTSFNEKKSVEHSRKCCLAMNNDK